MESHTHTLLSLFDQIGLDNKYTSVENFIDINSGIPGNVNYMKQISGLLRKHYF